MRYFRIVSLLIAGALTACAVASSPDASKAAISPGKGAVTAVAASEATPGQNVAEHLPSDACTVEGYWSFFEAFVRYPKVREAYTAASAREGINPFRIALVDYNWHYVPAGKEPGDQPLELKETRDGNSFRVDFVRVKLDAEGEVLETYGKSSAYVFHYVSGCWQLAQYIP